MFDGEVSHRNINLSKRNRQNKSEHLRAAREARQARSLQKLRETSATTIQVWDRYFSRDIFKS